MLEVYIENRSWERLSAKQMAAVLVRVLVAPFRRPSTVNPAYELSNEYVERFEVLQILFAT